MPTGLLLDSASSAAINDRTETGEIAGRGWNSAVTDLSPTTRMRVSVREGAELGSGPANALILSDRARLVDDRPTVNVQFENRLVQGRTGELDFDFGPRAGFSTGASGRSAGAGVIARVGQNIDRKRDDEPSWYLFAGADAHAVRLDPSQDYMGLTDLQTERRAIIGDAQAGIAYNLGMADVAVAYVRRERSYAEDSWGTDRTDGFATLSFTMRR